MRRDLFVGFIALLLAGPAQGQPPCLSESSIAEALQTEKEAYLDFLENGASTLASGQTIADRFSAAAILKWHYLGVESLSGDPRSIHQIISCYDYGFCELDKVDIEASTRDLAALAAASEPFLQVLFPDKTPPESAVAWSGRRLCGIFAD